MQSYTIIFDLDNTLADCEHRVHHVRDGKEDWDAFFDACDQDIPLPSSIIYNLISVAGTQVMEPLAGKVKDIEISVPCLDVLTGRPERVRGKTQDWFKRHNLVEPHRLLMRKDDDHRPDFEFKKWIYERVYVDKGIEVLCVFEDREQVVEMWRSIGVPCFQVAKGNY